MDTLIKELKEKVIEVLNLEEMTPEDIKTDTPLFGAEGLGLDSIDALELIVLYFVPIIGPVFDCSPWGHGLRASPTFMT